MTNLLSFVNEFRAGNRAPVFFDHLSVHDSEYDVTTVGRWNMPRATTEMSLKICDTKEARQWN